MRVLILFFTILFNVISNAQNTKNLTGEIDQYMNNVAMKDGFTGTLIVTRHGKTVFEKGYGLADRETNLPNSPDIIYNLGSTGSLITEMAVMLLVDQKKLSLSDPICKYLNDCPAAWKEITIDHLLSQKSGLPSYLNRPDIEKEIGKEVSKKEMQARFASMPLEFTPGEKFNVSSTGYYLLGLIIEKVSGNSLGDFIDKNIFKPLGMKHSTLKQKETMKNAARSYMVNGDSIHPAPFVHPSVMFGYGNLYGTAGDLLLWENSLHSNKLLSSSSLQHIDKWTEEAGFGDKATQMFGQNFRRYFKGSWGNRMHMLRFPTDSSVILLVTNNNSTKQDKFMRDIASMLYSTYTPPVEIKEVSVPLSVLERYLGNYEFAAGREIAITIENGKLHLQGTGRPRRELVAVSDTRFYIKGNTVFLEFEKTDGVVNELTLHEISTTIKAKRKE